MGHIGNTVQTAFTTFDKQTITGTGTSVYTLSHSVANEQEIEVFVNNVRQEGGSGKAYTVSGNQITFSENIASTDEVYVNFTGKAVQTVSHPSSSALQATTGTFSGALSATTGTFSGDLTVDTDTLYVDSTNNRVGIGTASPASLLHIASTTLPTISLEDTDNGFAASTINVENGGRDLKVTTPQDTIFVQGSSEVMRIDSSGTVSFHGISGRATGSTGHMSISEQSDNRSYIELGTTTTVYRGLVAFLNPNGAVGSISVSGGSTSYNTSSDYRLKTAVNYDWDATTRLKQLNPVRFNFIADADTTVDGFLAHEVQDVVPEAISGTKDEVDDDGNPVYQGIDQSKLVPLLTKALIEAVEKIEQLEARITALENA